MSLETLAWWACVKGLDVLACGDFTHPAWLAELRRKLRPAGDGLFTLREGGASGPARQASYGKSAEGAPRSAGRAVVGESAEGAPRSAGQASLDERPEGAPRSAERTEVGTGEALRPAGDGLFTLCEDDASRPAGQASFGEGEGLERLAGIGGGARFVLGTEVSCVYPQGGRTRRIHVLVFAPDFAAVDGLRKAFAPFGALESDGRPTLRLSARDLVEAAITVSPSCEAVPAHVWTPWYGALGSKGGFDSLEEAFGDMAPHIRAVETGLSSDPAMNWRAPELDGRTLVSFSDAHSAPRLGREFTAFSGEPSYRAVIEGLRKGRVEWTGEFYPQEGKYYYDGHRKCGARVAPEDAGDGRCPACGRPMTRGVLGRVAALSGRPPASLRADADGTLRGADGSRPGFRRLVPLQEVVAEALGRGAGSKAAREAYFHLIERVGPELRVLAEADEAEIAAAGGERVAEGVMRVRTGRAFIEPGFDGQYGSVRIWGEEAG